MFFATALGTWLKLCTAWPNVFFVRFVFIEQAAGCGNVLPEVLDSSYHFCIGGRLATLEANELVKLSPTCHFRLLHASMSRQSVTLSSALVFG